MTEGMLLRARPLAWPASLLLLAAATAAAHAGALANGFVGLDDTAYLDHVASHAWTEPFTTVVHHNYFPITLLSLAVEERIVGDAPFLYHLDNVLLHAIATVAVALFLRSLALPSFACWLVAALFGLHPMRVESVAWIAERKDLLCTIFSIASLWAWVRYRGARQRRAAWWLLSGLCLALALGSKSMAVTVPVLMLALLWHARRLHDRRAWIALLPFLALAVAAGIANLAAQTPGTEPMTVNAQLSLGERLGDAGRALVFYVARSIAPHGLSGYYQTGFARLSVLDWVIFAAALAGLLLWARRRPGERRELVLGLAFFLVPLAPVLRVIPFGGLSAWNDRYVYLASVGLFWMLALPVRGLPGWPAGPRAAGVLACALLLAALGVASHQRGAVWHDPVSFWTNALEAVPGSSVPLLMLGQHAWREEAEPERALEMFREAVRRSPECGPCYLAMALLHAEADRREASDESLEAAVAASPKNLSTLLSAAGLYMETGRPERARPHLETVARLRPDHPRAWLMLGSVHARAGRLAEARAAYERVLARRPEHGTAHHALGRLLLRAGEPDAALRHLERARELGVRVEARSLERARAASAPTPGDR